MLYPDDWIMGALVAQDASPQDPYPPVRPLPSVERATAPASNYNAWGDRLTEQEQVAAASEAAAARQRQNYTNALWRDPNSNRLGAVGEALAPQTPLDYAMYATGPLKALSVPARAAIYGTAAAMDPGE